MMDVSSPHSTITGKEHTHKPSPLLPPRSIPYRCQFSVRHFPCGCLKVERCVFGKEVDSLGEFALGTEGCEENGD